MADLECQHQHLDCGICSQFGLVRAPLCGNRSEELEVFGGQYHRRPGRWGRHMPRLDCLWVSVVLIIVWNRGGNVVPGNVMTRSTERPDSAESVSMIGAINVMMLW